jgi:1D-myo-inositol 3-kinase
MPRLLVVGHITWDKARVGEVLGGSAAYGALAAARLGWDAAVLTSAGRDFDPERDLPGIPVYVGASDATTRFHNSYDAAGERRQVLSARAADIDLSVLPDAWRDPEVLLLGPMTGEIGAGFATAFEAGLVGAQAQGWLRSFGDGGEVSPREWTSVAADLAGVHVLFLSDRDMPQAAARARGFLASVPMVALTRGWEGLTLHTREGQNEIPTLPREEVDPTGAGDVFAAAFLVRYHETHDTLEAAAFAACAASCAVEEVGAAGIGDRAEVLRRLAIRERLIEEGDWDE